MNTHAEKIVASVLATLAVGFMALWSVLPGWALYPPRLGVSSAVLVPFGHLGMSYGLGGWVSLLLAVGPILVLGAYLGWAWIRGRLRRALAISALVYGFAVGMALIAGVDRR
jgi:hypothetical protein